MAEYLIDNPPSRDQFRPTRRAAPSGVIVVHTAESHPDEVGPDDGAENVAAFIRRRSTAGSYHDLADSDSVVRLVPYTAEAYGDGTGSNPHAYHVSLATMAARWPTLPPEWRDRAIDNAARAAADYAKWLKATAGIDVPARRISRDQSTARVPGFIAHGERDPGRRTDPGAAFPWDQFLGRYAHHMGAAAPAPSAPAARPPASHHPKRSPATLPVLRRGAGGPLVEAIQAIVGARVDGDFGPRTEAAVRAWQRRARIAVDGVVGDESYGTAMAQAGLIARGDNGPAVRIVQAAARVAVDGAFGPVTDQAVREVQAWAGIGVDGKVGPDTRRALLRG